MNLLCTVRFFSCLRIPSSETTRTGVWLAKSRNQTQRRFSRPSLLFFAIPFLQCALLGMPSGRGFKTVHFPGSTTTVVQGINNLGQMVGNEDFHGFVAYANSFTIFDPPGSVRTQAAGINDLGQIVGSYFTAGGGIHGFKLDKGTFTTIDYPGAIATQLTGINNAQQIVGIADIPNVQSFQYANGIFTPINLPLPNFLGAFVNGINNSGQVTGYYYTVQDDAHAQGFVLSNGVLDSFDFPGAPNTDPTGINDAGDVVGIGSPLGPTGVVAFIRHGGVFSTFQPPSIPYGINNGSQIVGANYLSDSCGRPTIPVPPDYVVSGRGLDGNQYLHRDLWSRANRCEVRGPLHGCDDGNALLHIANEHVSSYSLPAFSR